MNLVLQLLTYNGSAFLPTLFDSLVQQTDKDWSLRIHDSGSSPEELNKTREIVRNYAKSLPIVFQEGENLGFAGGHEKLFHQHDAELILLVNHDVILEPDYISTVRSYMTTHEDVGAAEGAILRWEWGENGEQKKTKIVDSLGLAKARSHRVYDIGTGKRQEDAVAKMPQLFGVSGCLPMYRRSAVCEMLFDPVYFMYKEDVGMAYRLQKAGWKSALVPGAVAYHFRGVRLSLLHKDVSVFHQELSYKNHWRNLLTHLEWRDWLRDGWAIIPFELAKAVFFLGTHPGILFRTARSLWRHELTSRV